MKERGCLRIVCFEFILNISSIVKKILISMHRKYVVSNVLGIRIMILVRKFES